MGLDIYFHKVKKVRTKNTELKSVREYHALNNKLAKERFTKYADKVIKSLESATPEEYTTIYNRVFPRGIAQYEKYSFYYQDFIGANKPLKDVKKMFEKILRWYGAPENAYFRKANFVYNFFSPKLEGEACFVTKEDLETLIERCDKVLADKDEDTSRELLPTTSGFFFGSTAYDYWYYQDVKSCKRQMTKLLRGYNEDTDVIYVIMSW